MVQLGEWLVPSDIQVVDGDLVAYASETVAAPEHQQLLDTFARLYDTPDRIASFARRWGMLGLCEHELPASHNPPAPSWGQAEWCEPVERAIDGRRATVEAVRVWRQLAGLIGNVRSVGAAFKEGEAPMVDDRWASLWQAPPVGLGIVESSWGRVLPLTFRRSRKWNREHVAVIVRGLLGFADLQPRFTWPLDLNRPVFEHVPGSLYTAVVLELAGELAQRTDRVYTCSGCDRLYRPLRQPRANQRRYCDECRTAKVPQRDADRARRERRRPGATSKRKGNQR